MLRIAHLVDDQSAGGVTRYLDFIARAPGMAELADHRVVPVSRHRPVAPRDADVIVSHLAISWRGLPGLIALRGRNAGTPMIHVEHSYSEGFTAANVPARARFHALLRCAYALFDRVVAVSRGQAGWLTRRALVTPGALDVIRPAVDLSAFRALAPATGPVRRLAAIGRFDRQKGFDLLIRAFRLVEGPALRLTLHGDGPERARLEALAVGDPRITFAGFTDDPAAAIADCHALAMPSRWEPYGIVAAEARAAHRPVLVSGVDGLADHVARGAIRVSDFTVEGWSDAIAALVSLPLAPGTGPAGPHAELETTEGWRALLRDLSARTGSDPVTLSPAG